MKTYRLLPAAACACALAACNSGGSPLAPVSSTTQTTPARSFTPGHLYAAQGDDIASTVFRYPLNADGFPSKKPDGELRLGFRYVGSIAIGPDGDLYVSKSSFGAGEVDVFGPDASGRAKPVRVLHVPQNPLWVAVDQRGNLDVSTLSSGGGTTNVYAPNASGHDKPINTLSSDGANALAASHGIVYIETLIDGVQGLHERNGGQPVKFALSDDAANGVATDSEHLFAQFYYLQGSTFFLATDVFKLDSPGSPIRTIIGTGCRVSFSGGALGYGLAVYKKYLYEGCIGFNGAGGEVVVYDNTKSGKQRALERLNGGLTGVAIGP
ncbi:MAG TPA: hypothetical protein VGI15_08105 [Candidatus Cybelea sp.]|jgi:WD40 repeat protein